VLMYSVVILVPVLVGDAGTGDRTDMLVLVLALLVIATLVFGLDYWLSRGRGPAAAPPAEEKGGHEKRVWTVIRRTVADLRRMPRTAGVLALTHATVNWSLDFACLAATATALNIDVSLVRLATVYFTVQLVRQIPISPGGMGVVEVALLAGLVSAGATQGPAAAAMLVYRLLSCWIIIPIGLLTYAVLHSTRPVESAETPTPTTASRS
jgi:putative heme transporter